jgi:hypothetical protein
MRISHCNAITERERTLVMIHSSKFQRQELKGLSLIPVAFIYELRLRERGKVTTSRIPGC